MNKRIIYTVGVAALIIGIIIGIVMFFSNNSKSIDIELNTNYKALIGVKVKSNIIMVIDDKNKVSNILYLNQDSTEVLSNQKIEGKDIETAVELIVDKLKNKNEFNNNEILYLTNYSNDSIYNTVLDEFNKEFVVYGINNNLEEQNETLSKKLNELNLKNSSVELENVKQLDKYSKELLKD